MDNLTTISSIGLNDKDIAVIKSIIKLTPSLSDKFKVLENNFYQTADLLFIDADNKESVALWQKLIIEKPSITAILVTAKKTLEFNELAITYPIVINSVLSILSSAIQQQLNFSKQYGNPDQETKKLLIVDDSLAVLKYMEQKIPSLQENFSMVMDFADSGKSAMEKIKSQSYNLVFLDVVMPDVDGYKICKWIKKVRPKTRVIMLTSKKSPFDKVRGSMSGCDAYITKPPADADLKKAINKLI